MTYAQYGSIQYTDFNTHATNINSVWGVGTGDSGYGQTAVGSVTQYSTVSATSQWTSLYNAVNNARKHQSGAGYTLLTVPASGNIISYDSSLATTITAAYNNRGLFSANGTTVTGTNNVWNVSAGATIAINSFVDCNITFGTAQNARYFFNAGGKLNLVFTAVDNTGGNLRSTNARDYINAIGGVTGFANTVNGGRVGTGGTISVNNTGFGYRDLVYATATTFLQSDGAGVYSTDHIYLQGFAANNDTTNGANGNVVTLRLLLDIPADDTFGGSVDLTITSRLDIVPPESTYLPTNSWGTPTITYDNA